MAGKGEEPGAALLIIRGEREERLIELGERTLRVGLIDNGQLEVSASEEVPSDSVLVTIARTERGYVLTPSPTSPPIEVNRLPLQGEAMLQDGDQITFAGISAQLEFRVRRERWAHLKRALRWEYAERELRRWLSHDRTMRRKALVIVALLLGLVFSMWFIVNEYSLRVGIGELNERLRQQESTLSRVSEEVGEIKRKLDLLASNVEGELTMAGRISNTYGSSVSLIEATYGFVEQGTGKVLRYAETTEGGIAITHGEERFQVTTEGNGPAVEETVIGTGFLVARGYLLTNLHVARPWWQNEAAEQIVGMGFRPRLLALNAYFPTIPTPVPLEVTRVSEEYDLALCRLGRLDVNLPIPPLANEEVKVEVGQAVILLGYPAGIEALLARLDESVARQIITATAMRIPDVTRELATRGLIRPMVTQGHVSARLPGRIVHDAATTTGGSGGPLFNRNGVVIGINYAVLREFSASNLAVPVTLARQLLREQGIIP
ncbi:MAG: serine protease [Blastocatellia bacterium]|nr:serine protease [Blastocatellia bacterium]MCS7157253.1 serine protease [Blastocatellia bacterium]MCX7752058.1 serine protease [Blastocatellia bacterium]MDW8167164.1 trypsin-like peptidase domain-containing protein [Acidobacteriota bacterium]MDW8256489.1 trypsin-like peptidase domain-containing protein [Acidobacteriota bacterium]